MITIIDYGMGNLGSVLNMFKKIGAEARISSNLAELEKAGKILLPGVGAFDTAMTRIGSTPGMKEILDHKALVEKIPIMGICLGMQLLTTESEEGELKGFGWIPAKTLKFKGAIDPSLKIPHMGWNVVNIKQQHPMVAGFEGETRFYFVHSYYVRTEDPAHSLMETHYGIGFDSAIIKDNIIGAQFHPEKSHKFGMTLFKNFAALNA